MSNIAIFASGSGSNAENIIDFFRTKPNFNVKLILCNKEGAGVLERAKRLDVKSFVFNRDTFYNTDKVVSALNENKIDFIVLAGFLWLVPDNLLKAFPGKIVNIHPALLPKYGGKGMFGAKVHEAIVANGEKESGITIHYVNAKYDEGNIIFQAKCKIEASDTPDDVAQKVHKLEYMHFPRVIEELLKVEG